ncbi:MAG TPA: peptidase M14 [Lentisphaeria bacterium]|nr:MAG: hypothetical protein A2X45_17410 [Lentisphaerae bacterium GWF2_50_93]HCE44479.1 peptidase M14 [Lentisphaeria bacterium]
MKIDSNFPTGNIIFEKIDGDDVYLRQDMRDTEGDWFYWCFRIRDAGGRKLRFNLTGKNLLTDLGAAVSLDDGWTWNWLPRENINDSSFEYKFPETANNARFSMGMPYSERNLRKFLEKYRNNPDLKKDVLCKSGKGRDVEKLIIGNPDSEFRILITARHHCCEMMANYAVEGIIEAILNNEDNWFLKNAQVVVVPFVDKDGVEDGDQGKNRRPHDHNRDYIPDAVYNEIKAIMDLVPGWIKGRTFFALDIHCPWIKNKGNDIIYSVGSSNENNWNEQVKFGKILMKANKGTLPYFVDDNLPFGKDWNIGAMPGLKTSSSWMLEAGAKVSMSFEIPYSIAREKEVNQETAKEFGKSLAAAVMNYLRK